MVSSTNLRYLLTLLSIVPIVLAVLYAPIESDEAYYLSMVERIGDGYLPYQDFHLSYTPAYFYFLALIRKLFSIDRFYEFYLSVHFLIQIVNAYLIYKISLLFNIRKHYAFLAGVLFIIASHWNDGNMVLLEMPTVLLGMYAIYISLKSSSGKFIYLCIGLFASLSFLTKQYGAGYFFIIILIIIFQECSGQKTLLFLVGYSLPILISIALFDNNFLKILLGQGYGKLEANAYGMSNLTQLLDRSVFFFIRIFPCLLMTPFLLLTINRKFHFPTVIILICSIFGFLFQFYFAPYRHYYIIVIPFASILSFYLLEQFLKLKLFYILLLSITFLLSLYSTYYNRVYKEYILAFDKKKNQYLFADMVKKIIPEGNTLYVDDIGLVPIYYLTNRLPPNISSIGYSYGLGLSNKARLDQIKSADYIIKFSKEYPNYFGYDVTAAKKLFSIRRLVFSSDQIVILK